MTFKILKFTLFNKIFLSPDNIRVRLKFISSSYIKNGEEYMKFDKVQAQLKMSGFKITIKDLFKGDKVLNDVTNAIINQNIGNFITDIEPRIQSSIGE